MYCRKIAKKKNNYNNNKLTKRSDESTTKIMFHGESCLVAVYRKAEEKALHFLMN